MIIDQETNFVYLSGLLRERYPHLFETLTTEFDKAGIGHDVLKKTSDIWAVDYMPVQLSKDRFVQFNYDPDYLKGGYAYLRTDPGPVCDLACIKPSVSTIKADGGNLVKWNDKVIMTNKTFKENDLAEEQLVQALRSLLEVNEIIMIPTEPGDAIGHSDGMARFADANTVLVNEYKSDKRVYRSFIPKFEQAIKDAGLNAVYLPYTSNINDDVMDARGCYINYLHVGNHIFFPIFNQSEDEKAVEVINSVFPDSNVVTIDCSELAKEGGVLNCISWNILK